jgi:predicted DNA-binding transcriptional regulator AlpA
MKTDDFLTTILPSQRLFFLAAKTESGLQHHACVNINETPHLIPTSSVSASFATLGRLPLKAFISGKELSLLAGQSRTSIWRDIRQCRLPTPIAIGPQTRRWRLADVHAYLGGRVS